MNELLEFFIGIYKKFSFEENHKSQAVLSVAEPIMNGDSKVNAMSRLAEISKEISEIATGKSKTHMTITREAGDIVTVRTEVFSEPAAAVR